MRPDRPGAAAGGSGPPYIRLASALCSWRDWALQVGGTGVARCDGVAKSLRWDKSLTGKRYKSRGDEWPAGRKLAPSGSVPTLRIHDRAGRVPRCVELGWWSGLTLGNQVWEQASNADPGPGCVRRRGPMGTF